MRRIAFVLGLVFANPALGMISLSAGSPVGGGSFDVSFSASSTIGGVVEVEFFEFVDVDNGNTAVETDDPLSGFFANVGVWSVSGNSATGPAATVWEWTGRFGGPDDLAPPINSEIRYNFFSSIGPHFGATLKWDGSDWAAQSPFQINLDGSAIAGAGAAVPAPTAVLLAGIGLGLSAFSRRRRPV